jgi:hypothetical protein
MTITPEIRPAPITDHDESAFLRALGKRVRSQRVTRELSQEQRATRCRMSSVGPTRRRFG